MAQVVLEGVRKVFAGGILALDQVDLRVEDGEFLAIVGPSGCGKSTALRVIAGLETPTAGVVSIGNRVVNGVAPRNRDVAMVFQSYALYPHLTVRQNLAFGWRLRDRSPWPISLLRRIASPKSRQAQLAEQTQGDARLQETAEAFGIAPLLDRMPGQLSGGQRQRVALAKALVRRPAASLLDEPLSNVDAQLRVEIRRELKRIHQRESITAIYVTHDQAEALTLGDRIAVMSQGRIQQIGSAADISDRPANLFVAGFIGVPPMNLCEGRLRRGEWDDDGLRFETAGWAVRVGPDLARRLAHYVDQPIVLGVRPGAVRILPTPDAAEIAISGTVGLMEPLGDGILVELHFQGPSAAVLPGDNATGGSPRSLLCAAPIHHAPSPGSQAWASFDTSQAHWFDPQTGLRVEI